MIDPKTVQIRMLRFESLFEARAEVERLLAADQDGQLVANGNWTPGQIFDHLATWIHWGYDGYPKEIGAPSLLVRVLLRLFKRVILKAKAPQGFRMPGVPGGTFAFEMRDTQESGKSLIEAFDRLNAAAPPHPSPAFGVLAHEEAIALHLRHSELHLGYLNVRTSAI